MEKLSGVSETLLITLYFRYIETLREDGVIRDDKAVEIVERIDTNLSQFADDKISQFSVAARTKVFDEQTQAFLDKNPNTLKLICKV